MSFNAPCKRKAHRFAMWMTRRVFYEAQDGKCGICRRQMSRLFESPKFNFDHVWPKAWSLVSDNLQTFIGNILLVHESCNVAKADSLPSAEQVGFLHEVNRKLGLPPHETALWDTPEQQAAE